MAKFKFIKEVECSVNAYGHEGVNTNDTIEIDGHLAQKAANNPDFKEVKSRAKPKKEDD